MELGKLLSSYSNSGTGQEHLDVSGVDLSSKTEVEHLIDFLVNAQVAVVIADGCSINDKGCAKIAEHLRKNETIKMLSMRNNKIGNSGAKSLAKVIKSNKEFG